MRLVVDASVALKWFVQEDLSDLAAELLADFVEGRVELWAPEVLRVEVANGLRKCSASGVVDEGRVMEAIGCLADLGIEERRIDWDFLSRSTLLALRAHITVYDALYVSTAEELDTKVVTADEKLCRSRVKDRVMHIGDYSLR